MISKMKQREAAQKMIDITEIKLGIGEATEENK